MPAPSYLNSLPPEILQYLSTTKDSHWADPNSGYTYYGSWDPAMGGDEGGPGGFNPMQGITGESSQTFGTAHGAAPEGQRMEVPMYDATTGQFQNTRGGWYGSVPMDTADKMGLALAAAIGGYGLYAAGGALAGGEGFGGAGVGESVSGAYGATPQELAAASGSYGSGLETMPYLTNTLPEAGANMAARTLPAGWGTAAGTAAATGGTTAATTAATGAGIAGTGISAGQLLGAGAALLGGAAGAQGQKANTSQTRDIPEWLKPYVNGSGGLLDMTRTKLQADMAPGGMPGYDAMKTAGQGLLSQPVAGNGFDRFFGNGLLASRPY